MPEKISNDKIVTLFATNEVQISMPAKHVAMSPAEARKLADDLIEAADNAESMKGW